MKKLFFYFTAIFLFLILSIAPALAYYSLGTPQGFVNDFTNTLTPDQKQTLENKLSQFEKETSNEISVVIINNLKGDTIENFAVKLFEDWKIGKKNKDNGILLLVAADDHKMRIEVGYGLEGAITDAQSYWIVQNILRPAFQKNDYVGGITEATDKIMAAAKAEYTIPSANPSQTKKIDSNLFWTIGYFFFAIFIYLSSILARSKSWWAGGIVGAIIGLIIFSFSQLIGLITIIILTPLGFLFDYIVSKNYQERKTMELPPAWWAGGSFGNRDNGGGGFGGFSGGSSGGGGASGDW